ncbi:DNA damage tolerance protein rad31 [Penicillium atrosanguineum]|uniref:Ubiquitin-like 1-activating enzyme E1A n=1 Tax=Penicillium atrosanguineum TaxID=1132637 RepID=A0A9W9L5R3_9EURO|nr:major facilitator superfamily domain-containing protein [Penicillium atrosanguineum]KAJ5126299.1 DNA damage tolerance protein rad31 [Penicillium atrosanguineum]KAJ5137057.1 DNA damage tolerance protein rad31 [Penicillium atrosanguineum]KAJ5293389.1 major facilitator superfamily domain-containing protein [Penicillium atrosanguineum]KAJ5302576.1 DNA damage tolerance protein rad31 [Penicillium atrosanguineum]
MAEPAENGNAISADEIALYDRQIRLWGVHAQEKIRSANILLVTVKALANEVAKNLVLAGIGSLTIIDHEPVTEADLDAQFFLEEAHRNEDIIKEGKNRAEVAGPQIHKMNPRVKLHIDTSDIRTKQPNFFAQFDVTIATELDYETNNTINAACRLANKPFYAAGLHGFYGYVFADLITHDFVIERSKSNIPSAIHETQTRSIVKVTTKKEGDKTIELVTKRETYSPLLLANTSPLPEDYTRLPRRRKQVTPLLSCLRALWEFEKLSGGRKPTFNHADLESFTKLAREVHQELKLDMGSLDSAFLRNFLQNLGCELSPVAAFLGGSLAQDVINVLSAREQPLQNMLLFDGEKSIGPIYSLHPFFPPEMGMESLGAVPPVGNPIPMGGNGAAAGHVNVEPTVIE